MFRVDHLVGLESFQGLIYCSETTRRFLLNMRDTLDGPPKYRGVERKLVSRIVPGRPPTAAPAHPLLGPLWTCCMQRALAVGETHTIELPTMPISVTLLPANHCPGSVM